MPLHEPLNAGQGKRRALSASISNPNPFNIESKNSESKQAFRRGKRMFALNWRVESKFRQRLSRNAGGRFFIVGLQLTRKVKQAMNSIQNQTQNLNGLTLVLGGTGKTGRRIAAALEAKGKPTRIGSRSATPAFDWHHAVGWDACLKDVEAVYINYAPDLAMPGAADAVQAFVDQAKRYGIQRLVLLSGRGEAEAQACERIVQESGMDWTIVRASWFNQNFSEGAFLDMVMAGQITLPAGDIPEPFVDVDDIAEVAVAALTEPGHAGAVYEVTGPRLMTFADIATELSNATGREIIYVPVPHEAFVAGVKESGAPKEVVWMLDYLFTTVLDGRNAHLTDGIQRALGRPPKDFTEYAKEVAATGLYGSPIADRH
ncbi:MAG: NAD(P)H-binding protein [Elainellaceae cyanobacterium]